MDKEEMFIIKNLMKHLKTIEEFERKLVINGEHGVDIILERNLFSIFLIELPIKIDNFYLEIVHRNILPKFDKHLDIIDFEIAKKIIQDIIKIQIDIKQNKIYEKYRELSK